MEIVGKGGAVAGTSAAGRGEGRFQEGQCGEEGLAR